MTRKGKFCLVIYLVVSNPIHYQMKKKLIIFIFCYPAGTKILFIFIFYYICLL